MILQPICRQLPSEAVAQRLEKAFTFLRGSNLSEWADGTYPVDGEEIYAMVQSFHVESPIDVEFETHRKYIDIQYVISGHLELMTAHREDLIPVSDYDPKNDVVFYQRTDKYTAVRLQPGQAAILMPEDGHRMVCFPGKEPVDIRKCVVKVMV